MLSYASFVSALIPLGALILMRREFPASYWIVGIAWLVSVAQDAIFLLDGTWLNTYVGHFLLYSLLAVAVVESGLVLTMIVAVLGMLTLLGINEGMAGPDMWVAALGSVSVLYYARPPLFAPLVAYCGAGTIFYLGYAFSASYYDVAFGFWIGQKLAYLTAFVLFIRAAHIVSREAT